MKFAGHLAAPLPDLDSDTNDLYTEIKQILAI